MDAQRFDLLVKTFSAPDTRRGLLRLVAAVPLAGALATLVGREVSLADSSGAIVGGGNRRNRGKPNRRDNRDNDKERCGKKCGPCKRCKDGKCKKKRDGTVCQGNGVCTNGRCTNGDSTPPPPPTCDPVVECTSATMGTPCCPTQNPNVQCAGGLGLVTPICQDCTRAPTVEGAFCQAGGYGNQCCRGDATCFVGVQHVGGALGCFSASAGGDCRVDACDENEDCPPEAPVCMRVAGTVCCDRSTQPGVCVARCP